MRHDAAYAIFHARYAAMLMPCLCAQRLLLLRRLPRDDIITPPITPPPRRRAADAAEMIARCRRCLSARRLLLLTRCCRTCALLMPAPRYAMPPRDAAAVCRHFACYAAVCRYAAAIDGYVYADTLLFTICRRRCRYAVLRVTLERYASYGALRLVCCRATLFFTALSTPEPVYVAMLACHGHILRYYGIRMLLRHVMMPRFRYAERHYLWKAFDALIAPARGAFYAYLLPRRRQRARCAAFDRAMRYAPMSAFCC